MEIELTEDAQKDLDYWKKTNNKPVQKRITILLHAILQDPQKGIGKPEQLKYNHSGKWSRRINDEHRLIYSITQNKIIVYSFKGHY